MRIFVTGATGFLGAHLVPALTASGHEVTATGSVSCDLLRDDSLAAFTQPYDQIWHLAAWTQAGDFCVHHPGEQWLRNQRINTNVLHWWATQQPQAKLIAIGTSCSYPPGASLLEDDYLSGEPVPELYAYAMTKRMLLVGLRALASQFGLTHLLLVPSTLCGPGYHAAAKQWHFIFDVIRKIVDAKHTGERVVLWGDGHQRREIVHVDDFVRAAILLAGAVDNQVVNIGSGHEYSIRWYAEQICRMVDYDSAAVNYDMTRYTGARSKLMSTARLAALLPEFRMRPVEQVIAESVRWYQEERGGRSSNR